MLESVADKMPELYRFTHASLACSPKLIYNTYTIESAEGSQQGDPLSGLEFCEAVYPTLSEGSARTKLGYVDDVNLDRKISNVAQDVQRIVDTQAKIGLVLDVQKCEIIANKFDLIDQYSVFSQFKKSAKGGYDLPGLSGSTQQGNGQSLAGQDR